MMMWFDIIINIIDIIKDNSENITRVSGDIQANRMHGMDDLTSYDK